MANSNPFNRILLEVISNDFKFLPLCFVDMETAKKKPAGLIGENRTYGSQDIGYASVGTGTDYGISLLCVYGHCQFILETIWNDSFRSLSEEMFKMG
ncbi:MAG: hypothetical protein IKB63_04170, partial [Parabacteroides sp.]|nr:hypothetical protein [Parabacteroides sp.]